jgi:copper chaperone CopZ
LSRGTKQIISTEDVEVGFVPVTRVDGVLNVTHTLFDVIFRSPLLKMLIPATHYDRSILLKSKSTGLTKKVNRRTKRLGIVTKVNKGVSPHFDTFYIKGGLKSTELNRAILEEASDIKTGITKVFVIERVKVFILNTIYNAVKQVGGVRHAKAKVITKTALVAETKKHLLHHVIGTDESD